MGDDTGREGDGFRVKPLDLEASVLPFLEKGIFLALLGHNPELPNMQLPLRLAYIYAETVRAAVQITQHGVDYYELRL